MYSAYCSPKTVFRTANSDGATYPFFRTNATHISVNISESDEGFTLQLATPGFNKESFTVEANNKNLIVKGEKKETADALPGKVLRQEFLAQSFTKTFVLPSSVDASNLTARYQEGILTIWLPKAEEAKPKPKRNIEVK